MTTILEVPTNYPTIQAAVDAWTGTTQIIQVLDGTYFGTVNIPVGKDGLIIRGARYGVDARTRTGPESVITFLSLPVLAVGLFNVYAKNVTIDGFTFTGIGDSITSLVAGTAAIRTTPQLIPLPLGVLPTTSTIDVTGLRILNNRFVSNANAILASSIEPTVPILTDNYVVQRNYFRDNLVNLLNNGKGVYFGNDAIPLSPPPVGSTFIMSRVRVLENLFDGFTGALIPLLSNTAINLHRVQSSLITNNIVNRNNSIYLDTACDSITVSNNNIYSSAFHGIILDTNNTNIAIQDNNVISNAIYGIVVGSGNINVNISGNCINGNTVYGILIAGANSNIIVLGNNITNNGTVPNSGAGIRSQITNPINGFGATGPNSGIIINGNNFESNLASALFIQLNSITGAPVDANVNWWQSASGPNYNGNGPGTGQVITDQNLIPAVVFTVFDNVRLSIICPSQVQVVKTTPIGDVIPGQTVFFTVTITVTGFMPFTYNSFIDALPAAPGSTAGWSISTQSPGGIFSITGTVPNQSLAIPNLSLLVPGTYTATVAAIIDTATAPPVNIPLLNTATASITYAGLNGYAQSVSASATATIAMCIHRSSLIKLADGNEIEIDKIEPNTAIVAADGSNVNIVSAIKCWVSDPHGGTGRCVVFEPDSIAPGVPTKRFGIDAGHPMAIPSEYNDNHELKPAKEFINDTTIYAGKWSDLGYLFEGENLRYDIIMPEDSCKAYFANGVVVKARQDRTEPGYSYF